MDIKDRWQAFFGEQVPIAYLLRPQNADRWFRIHSLPESKRYPEDEAEMQEVLRRHNTIAYSVLGEDAAFALFLPEYHLETLTQTFPELIQCAALFCYHEDQWGKITLWAVQTVWSPHAFDSLLRLVAIDEIRYVSWMNLESGEVFAPYDGGADLFLSSMQRRDELRTRYTDWLSPYPTGL